MQAFLNKFDYLSSLENKCLYKITGKEEGTLLNAWWILRVEPQKLSLFSHVIKGGNVVLGNYGIIEDSGYGKEVPESVLEKFGFTQVSDPAA